MTTERAQCIATTHAGTACRNRAIAGSEYCRVHQPEAEAAVPVAAEALPVSPADTSQDSKFDALVEELNELATEIRRLQPQYTPPPFSPEGLVNLLRQNLDRFTPEMQKRILRELERVQVKSPTDFLNLETWQDLWYVLHASLQTESTTLRRMLTERLASIPGIAGLVGLPELIQSTLQTAKPQDFLELDTWKGLWTVLNYSVQSAADDFKRRVFHAEET